MRSLFCLALSFLLFVNVASVITLTPIVSSRANVNFYAIEDAVTGNSDDLVDLMDRMDDLER